MDIKPEDYIADHILGGSSEIVKLRNLIKFIGPLNTRVLIYGESGTGKEMVAKAIHSHSERAYKPFIAKDLIASQSVLESELFGHEKGAFTGAIETRIGAIEQAYGGTLFLDETQHMPYETQEKLHRTLGENTFTRVGGKGEIKADFRLITASSENLEKLVEEGKFIGALYHRIAVLPITIPPLRDRGDDIILLAKHYAAQYGKFEISKDANEFLLKYEWLGNVRELINLVEAVTIYKLFDASNASKQVELNNEGKIVLEKSDFERVLKSRRYDPKSGSTATYERHSLIKVDGDQSNEDIATLIQTDNIPYATLLKKIKKVKELERLLFSLALREYNGHQRQTAEILGMDQKTLRGRLRNLGIDPTRFRQVVNNQL